MEMANDNTQVCVCVMCSFYDTTIVLIAVAITAAVCLGVTCFAVQTKYDFTMCGGLLFMLMLVLFMFGISCIIVFATVGYSYVSDLSTNILLFPRTD